MNQKSANILIVDDDPAIHRMIGRILRLHPLELFSAYDGSVLLSRALESCADDFSAKTDDFSEIIARMEYRLKRKLMLDQLRNDHLNCQDIVSLKSGSWPSP